MMHQYIEQQLAAHPSIMPQDIIKMCFQAAYGAEHLLRDIDRVHTYFDNEYENCKETNEPIIEMLADDVCRVNLGAWKKHKLPPKWLFDMFVQAASTKMENSQEKFFSYIDEWEKAILELQPPSLRYQDFKAYVGGYIADSENGQPYAVHHSQNYRDAEHPAYRVVSGAFIKIAQICSRIKLGQSPYVIAFDGRSGAGKTTIVAGLESVVGSEIVCMDDFFLPQALRTPERLAEPGGNIHYERFKEEVLPNLSKGEPFTYQVFDCISMSIISTKTVNAANIIAVEGAYSHHPIFGNYMDMKVFVDIHPADQIKRIIARDGKNAANMFLNRWIPMEEKYLAEFDVKENADLVL